MLLPQNHHKDKDKTISSSQEQLTPPPAAVALLKTAAGAEGEWQSYEAEQLNVPTTWQLGDPQLKRSRQDQTKARRALEVSWGKQARWSAATTNPDSPSAT